MNPKMIKAMFGTDQLPKIALSLQDIPREAQNMVGKMSISGVQPKLSLKLNNQNTELLPAPSGGEYILKPQIPHFPHTPENENCCMDIAFALGIDVPPHCLIPLQDGSLAYVVKRFDRRDKEKIHQEDFYQILEKKDKYRGSLEEIGKKLREISAVPGLDIQLFFERVVFYFLIGNGDGHFKNYSVSYHAQNQIRLSPAYDIVCSKLVLPDEEDSALTVNGKRNKLTPGDFNTLADRLKIPPKIRFEKFACKGELIKQHIEASKLPDNSRRRFLEITRARQVRRNLL